ncbi:MAG: hypothetical protein GY754_21535 [bacterium]|nr:hypothetical protein [bacterium]
MFGHQLKFVIEVLKAKNTPVYAGDDNEDDDAMQKRVDLAQQYTRMVMQAVISVGILIVCFYLLFSNENKEMMKIASGFIGIVVGYWLR